MSQIVEQARLDKIPLSEIEKKELYYSADAPSFDEGEANAAFEREFEQDKFERKIKKLATAAGGRVYNQGMAMRHEWSEAVGTLKKGDHYLSVMVGKAAPIRHPFIDLLRAVSTGLVLSALGVAILALLEERFPILRSREGRDYVFWIMSSAFVGLYCVGWFLFGRKKVDDLIGLVLDPPLNLVVKVLEWAGLTPD